MAANLDKWLYNFARRNQAAELSAILKGEVEPRESLPVPSIKETAARLLEIYVRIL